MKKILARVFLALTVLSLPFLIMLSNNIKKVHVCRANLTAASAALRQYQLENENYPEQWDYSGECPLGGPPTYQKTEESFLLTCTGPSHTNIGFEPDYPRATATQLMAEPKPWLRTALELLGTDPKATDLVPEGSNQESAPEVGGTARVP